MNHSEITYVDEHDNIVGQGTMQDAWSRYTVNT